MKYVTDLLTRESPGDSNSEFRRLIYPQHLFPVEDPVAQKTYEHAISAAEMALNVRAEAVDIPKRWEQFRLNITSESYEEYFASVSDLLLVISRSKVVC